MLKFFEFEKGEKKAHYVYDEDGSKTIPWSYKLSAFEDAGIKVPNTVVVVDFDNHDDNKEIGTMLKKIISYFDNNYPTFKVETNSGYHLYYRKPRGLTIKNWNKTTTTCGVPVDYKTGVPVAVKLNGKVRKTNKSFDELKFSELPELPVELYPIVKSKNLYFLGMSVGERDSSLFNHLLNVKETIDNANLEKVANFINDYLFLEPLDEKQIKEKIRNVEEREIKPYYDGKTLNVNEFANLLIENEHICKINGQLYIFNGEIYVNGREAIETAMIKYIPNLLSAKRTEVYKMIGLILSNQKEKKYAEPNLIAFKNGVYDLNTDDFIPVFNPNDIITNQIPWDYNKNANNQRIKDILNNWVSGDEKTLLLLEECIGMCMYRSNRYSASLFLVGDKDNGKSTFINMIKGLVGKDNFSTVGLHNLERRFYNYDIIGKLVNLGDDIGDEYIAKTETFKKLATGDTVQLERKGEQAVSYDSYAKLIFNANEIPNIKDPTGAVVDKRMIAIPFNTTFIKGTKDRNLSENFKNNPNKDMMETLILIGIEGIKRVIKNNGFTESELSNKTKEEYKKNNDVVYRFIEEYGEENIIGYDEPPILMAFKEYCKDDNSSSSSKKILRAGIKRILNCEVGRRDSTVKEMKEKGLIKRQKIPYYREIIDK